MTESAINILIATPCYGGLLDATYHESIIKFISMAEREGLAWGHVTYIDSLISRSRNVLAAYFMAHEHQYTHLIFIDADIGFGSDAIPRLLSHDKDVVAVACPMKDPRGNREERAVHLIDNRVDGLDEASLVGTGFLQISRAAIEKMWRAYPELKCMPYKTDWNAPLIQNSYYTLFDPSIDPETHLPLSEDYAFCWRWRNIGGQIWVDTSIDVTHAGRKVFCREEAWRPQ